MNPIRSLAPCIVNHSFPEYLWIYFVGPIAGVILAVLVYKLVVALEYESAQDQNPTPELILPIARHERTTSSIIPMASVGPPTVEKQVREPGKRQTNSVSFSNEQTSGDDEKPVLPTCYAD
jgi:aquaporin rerated protein, other eukaryote